MDSTHRRGFLNRVFGAAVALGLPLTGVRQASAAQANAADAWLSEVKGTHRCFFDFPRHMNGVGLLHILNYLNTYSVAYKAAPGTVGAVGTFYGIGGGASIALAFNDAMWAKYGLGEYTGLKDAAGKPYARNPFHRPTKNELHLLMQAMQTPTIPMFAEAMPAMGIESLQKMGAKFLICANALGAWAAELEARAKGTMAAIDADLRANLLPGVTIVPAMVIAIEQAQAVGVAYNRQ
jgi:intracellular sulfur oxidation DsrE/DsrF family protein